MRVAAARNQAEAEFLQGLLLEEGIPSLAAPLGRLRRPRLPRRRPARHARAARGELAARELLGTRPAPPVARAPRRPGREAALALAALVLALVLAGVVSAVLS